jgi:hypothetical protein
MVKALLLIVAFLICTSGMAWLALSLEAHWRQLRNGPPSLASVRQLRLMGWTAIIGSLPLCLAADHASMAALVWIMTLAASALSVAFSLTWRPRLLAPLIAWTPAPAA